MAGDEYGGSFIRERLFVAEDLEIRGGGRTIFGIAVPFNQVATVNDGRGDYQEMFKPGAFTRTISDNAGQRVKLMANHDAKRFPIGRTTTLREERSGLYGEFHISATRDGDETLALIHDRVLDSFSIGFSSIRHERNAQGVVERLEVAVREISVVSFPAYAGAAIGGARAHGFDGLDGEDEVLVSSAARRRRLLEVLTRQDF